MVHIMTLLPFFTLEIIDIAKDMRNRKKKKLKYKLSYSKATFIAISFHFHQYRTQLPSYLLCRVLSHHLNQTSFKNIKEYPLVAVEAFVSTYNVL